MGKKSKKKGGAANKAARKAKLQERREQQLEQLDQYSDDDGDEDHEEVEEDSRPDREYFVGDRVWFYSGVEYIKSRHNHNTYRGIVHAVDGDYLEIKPLQSYIDGVHYTRRVPIKTPPDRKTFVFPDFYDFTLRFDSNRESVICAEHDWELGSFVKTTWPLFDWFPPKTRHTIQNSNTRLPVDAEDPVPHYKCNKFINGRFGGPVVVVGGDDDQFIKRRPTSFRFKVGDQVTFNSERARGDTVAASNYLQRNTAWTEGDIILVNVYEEGLAYAAYECSFKVGKKKHSCLIDVDDDEHIALICDSPRKRLFDAIEQDCSYRHFMYLSSHFDIDVAAFGDLLLMKAIKFASYNALTWLQQHCDVDVQGVKDDEDGNSYLHLIASSHNAYRFIRKLGKNDPWRKSADETSLYIFNNKDPVMKRRNKNGDVWLQPIVDRGDVKALDLIFSPRYGLAWENPSHYHHDNMLAHVKKGEDPLIQHIFDAFVSFHTIYQQICAIRESFPPVQSEQTLLKNKWLSLFDGNDAKERAKQFTRFYRDWRCQLSELNTNERIFCYIVRSGWSRLFQLLYEADQGLFESAKYLAYSKKDQGEFITKELRGSVQPHYQRSIAVSIYEACVLGNLLSHSCEDNFELYASAVKDHFLTCAPDSCPSLRQHLSERQKLGAAFVPRTCQEHRLDLLNDESDVEGRKLILQYLLRHRDDMSLNILFPLQNRQCWALRVMTDEKYLELEKLAEKEISTRNASNFSFLSSGQIPPNMTVRSCLAFVAVQYDDLQSLEWLCKSVGPPDDLVGGWNILHYSAFMGRLEIVGWLSTQPIWSSLVSQVSTRKDYEGLYAVHIAASRSHLHVCDLLIGLNAPLEDENGKPPEHHAKDSEHGFVRKWVENRTKPVAFATDVVTLLNLVIEQKRAEEIKDYIISTGCLRIDAWKSCCFCNVREKIGGLSFQATIATCCKHPDIELVKWICIYHFFSCDPEHLALFWVQNSNSSFPHQLEIEKLQRDELVSFAREKGFEDLLIHLQGRWFQDISCRDPKMHKYILDSALGGDQRIDDVRAAILRVEVLLQIAKITTDAIIKVLKSGGRVGELRELLRIHTEVRKVVMDEADSIFEDGRDYPNSYRLEALGMNQFRPHERNPTIQKLLLFCRENQWYEIFGLHTMLVTEGYADLLHFCLSNFQGWTVNMELNTMRIASFFGHNSIVEMLLNPCSDFTLCTSLKDRHKAAILGAGEGLRCRDLEFLLQMLPNIDESMGHEGGKILEGDRVREYVGSDPQNVAESLIVAVLNGYANDFYDSDVDNKTAFKTLKLLVDKNIYAHDDIIFALKVLLDCEWKIEWKACVLSLLMSAVDMLGIHPISHAEDIQKICKIAVSLDNNVEEEVVAYTSFFKSMSSAGIDIQVIEQEIRDCGIEQNAFWTSLINVQQQQLSDWARLDIVKKGGSLSDIQYAIKHTSLTVDSRDMDGLLLSHLSAAYDRVDILEWLVVSEGIDLDTLDSHQRTALDVAIASKASLATKWIIEWKAKTAIGSFIRCNHLRLKHKRRMLLLKSAATLIQSVIRSYNTRKNYANLLVRRMEESPRFLHTWGKVIASLDSKSISITWADIREDLIDIKVGLDDEMLDDTDQRLTRAVDEAMESSSNATDDDDVVDLNDAIDFEGLVIDDSDAITKYESEHNANNNSQWLSFQVTSHVVKFLQQGDKKYRSFFVRRMRQLAAGERSRILQKPLKGSKTNIYETYLEQKSGHRILWTEEAGNLVIWYIAKHKQVSRLMHLIDDSKSRSARQQMPTDLVEELQNEGLLSLDEPRKEVLLDIFGNVPLKIYDVSFSTINEIAKDTWTPQLHLTDEEREIVQAEGTMLVLGRSGTGKTVCICNRIECDRQSRDGRDPSFSQLFVARSTRLCRYVAGAVGEDNRASFLTYTRLLQDIDLALPSSNTRNFIPSQKVDFKRFKRGFHSRPSSNTHVSALILWTVIRTFSKGSIEAFQSPGGILPREDFLEVNRLGKNRCRIPAELRGEVYDEFLQYQRYLEDNQFWDDCDRVRYLLLRMKELREVDRDAFLQIQRSKVYVDEVQDYTQLEILLFFYLSGPNGLFLAGDPAQSVVEGTEFRFEEVRSVGHFVGSTIQKPKTVNVNFRSHSGILKCAGGVLDFLFTHFPSSAKQLRKDRGLFQGSRPGVLTGATIGQLNTLLKDKLKGAVVLAQDESAAHWRRLLNDYKLVYGIREAKGLEFKTVIILDFFREIPSLLQKPWRELMLGRVDQDFELSYPLVGTFLKLLYTGVTRCIEKLFFVETKASTAGDASMRWLTKKVSDRASYATRNNINDVEAMSMTCDEFISEGINNAELAQAADELNEAQLLLERSIWCFEQADVVELAAKARIHYNSISFRSEILLFQDEKDENDRAVMEMRAAQLMESLTKEGFFFEVLNLFSSVTPLLSDYTVEEMEKRFIRKIRLAENEE